MSNVKKTKSLLESFGDFTDAITEKDDKIIALSDAEFEKLKEELSLLSSPFDTVNYSEGVSYGKFDNSKSKAIELGYLSVYINGVTLHFNTIENIIKINSD